MKEKIHPNYIAAKVVCACGNSFVTASIKSELHVEVCAKCHPFFTGKQHLMDIQGRVERFNKRYGKSVANTEQPASAEAAPAS